MIVARGNRPDGRQYLVLGLSEGNLEHLRADQPIQVNKAGLEQCGFPELEVVIVYGATELELAKRLAPHMFEPGGET